MNIDKVYKRLEEEFSKFKAPIVDLIEAQTKDPFKVLVGTILSARTKDQTTSMVANKLFSVIDNYKDLKKLSIAEIEKLIYPAGFYRNKAKYLKKLPQVLEKEFAGEVPSEIEDLLKLPGVGRKTANLVRTIAFRQPAMCVDVHVHRICNRWGYVETKNPHETEMALRQKLPQQYWQNFNSYVVAFGQNHCTPRNPKCSSCPIYDECERIGVKTKYDR
ncbi:MAG: endonuclease [Candidatus Cloacimonadota bacterium]|jgi:endonuclease III|nr:endonuclease [Candidatus Cloacimonadota bacterium]